jgi:DNA polymerase-3 subunit beta
MPDGDVEFEVQQKDGLKVASIRHETKRIRYTMRCRDDFAGVPDMESAEFFDVPSAEFRRMIQHTAYAVSTEEKRYFLNGVFFEKDGENLVMVATDSRRLALESRAIMGDVAEFPPSIVHPKILGIVAKHAPDEGSISIAADGRSITFKFSNYVLSSSLIDGKFPNYRRVIPESQPHKFAADFAEFFGAVKRINVMGDAGKMFFDIAPGVLSVHANGEQGEAREEIPCEYAGEPVVIAINPRYVEDALKVMDTERVAFEFSEALRGVTLRPEPADGYFNILMPMQQN